MSHAAVPPSGDQHEISAAGYTCVVTEVGATVRVLRHEGRDLVTPWEVDEVRPVSRGALLAPWPNRVADGAYRWRGRDLQLPITEVARRNATHGLVSWAAWTLADRTEGAVVLTCRVHPRPGWPGVLDLEVTYALGAKGLVTTLRATNAGAEPLPYGCAPHPYLVAGPGRVDDCQLELPASRVLEVDPERLLPSRPPVVSDVPVDLDFRTRRAIGATQVDHALTGLSAGPDGDVVVALTAPEAGTGVVMRWDPAVLLWVQVHTADRPEPRLDRSGLAVEPMTCPPDAFGSGTDLVELAPGESHEASWTVAAAADAGTGRRG